MYEIIEGDCLAVMRGLPDCSIDAIITDPPYGTTACKWDSVIPFAPMWEQLRRIAKPRAAIVLFASQPFTSALVMSNPGMFKYTWVWNKNNAPGFASVKYHPFFVTEDVCVFGDGTIAYNPQMERRDAPKVYKEGGPHSEHYTITRRTDTRAYTHRHPKNLINISRCNHTGETLHPTQKPVALMEYLVRTYTNEGETVLDFTAGSGTTGVACVNTGRNFIGIEREPQYVAIARQRIAAASQQPALAGIA